MTWLLLPASADSQPPLGMKEDRTVTTAAAPTRLNDLPFLPEGQRLPSCISTGSVGAPGLEHPWQKKEPTPRSAVQWWAGGRGSGRSGGGKRRSKGGARSGEGMELGWKDAGQQVGLEGRDRAGAGPQGGVGVEHPPEKKKVGICAILASI